jgi:hypothetical protein
MIARRQRTAGNRRERGYGLLVVVFLVTALLITAMAIAPNILTEGRRDKEKELIWRGKQYARGVKLFVRKNQGRFPTSLDDLTKPKIGNIRFMRQAYKDPMNSKDGSWRLIYVGPAGQLIGSLKPPQQNLQFPQAGAVGTPASALGSIQTPVQTGATSQPGQGGTTQGGTPPGGATPGTNPPGTTGTPVSADQGGATSNPQPIPAGDTPTIMGGNIIGVGSKINKPSVMIYEKAKNYRLFEFIWDPSKDTFGMGQPGMQSGTGLGQIPGQNPLGQPGQNPTNPPQNPPPPQNPQQQQ